MCKKFLYLLVLIHLLSLPPIWGKELVWHQRSDVLSGKDFVYIDCPGSSLNSCIREKMNLPGNEKSIELKGSRSKKLPLTLYLNSANSNKIITVEIKGKIYPVKWSNDYSSETVTTEELLKIKDSSPRKSFISRVSSFFHRKKINDQLSGVQGCCDKTIKKSSRPDSLYTYLEKCFNRLEENGSDGKPLILAEGIYRISGNRSEIETLVAEYKKKKLNKCPGDDVHNIVGIIKKEIIDNKNLKMLDINNYKDGDSIENFVLKEKERLSPEQKNILCLFLNHLNKVVKHQLTIESKNKMLAKNLAIAVGINFWKYSERFDEQQEILGKLIDEPKQFCEN